MDGIVLWSRSRSSGVGRGGPRGLCESLDDHLALRVAGGSCGSMPVTADASLVPLGRLEWPLGPVSCMPSWSLPALLWSSPRRLMLFVGLPCGFPASSLETSRPAPLAGAYWSGWKERWALGLSCWRVSSTSGDQPCCLVPLCGLGPSPCRGWDGFSCLAMMWPAFWRREEALSFCLLPRCTERDVFPRGPASCPSSLGASRGQCAGRVQRDAGSWAGGVADACRIRPPPRSCCR